MGIIIDISREKEEICKNRKKYMFSLIIKRYRFRSFDSLLNNVWDRIYGHAHSNYYFVCAIWDTDI